MLARVDRVLDPSWLRAEAPGRHAADGTRRPGIDPGAAVRFVLAGFLLGVVHGRRLLRGARADAAIRRFAGFGPHEALPDHSPLARIRRRWGAEPFRQVFARTVRAAAAAGVATGGAVHIGAAPIRADAAWGSLGGRHAGAVPARDGTVLALAADGEPEAVRAAERKAARDGKRTGKHEKACPADPDAAMATDARNRRPEPAHKQRTAVDDAPGVALDVEATAGRASEGGHVLGRADAVAAATGAPVRGGRHRRPGLRLRRGVRRAGAARRRPGDPGQEGAGPHRGAVAPVPLRRPVRHRRAPARQGAQAGQAGRPRPVLPFQGA